jgi:hypothetical protein
MINWHSVGYHGARGCFSVLLGAVYGIVLWAGGFPDLVTGTVFGFVATKTWFEMP